MRNRKSSSVNFSLGILFSLSMVFIAFEWSTESYVPKPIVDREVHVFVIEEYPPVPVLEEKKKTIRAALPKMPKLIDLLVVDNDIIEPEDEPDFNEPEKALEQLPVFASVVEDVEDNTPYSFAENMPVFPGGQDALFSFLSKNINYPQLAMEMGVQGMVFVQFVVEKDGSVSNVILTRGRDALLDKEAMRVIKQLPNWKPGLQNGKPVRVRMSLPVNFVLN